MDEIGAFHPAARHICPAILACGDCRPLQPHASAGGSDRIAARLVFEQRAQSEIMHSGRVSTAWRSGSGRPFDPFVQILFLQAES
jgi:hypothetical protein